MSRRLGPETPDGSCLCMTLLRNLAYCLTSATIGAVVFCIAAMAMAFSLMRLVSAADQSEHDKQCSTPANAYSYGHEELSKPANPMKARDRQPAMINVNAVPLATSGTVTSSLSSLIDAIITSASVKPRPAPHA